MRGLVELRASHAGVELDAVAQPEAVGHVVGITQQLGLRRVALAPVPVLLQRFIEAERVFQALDVDPRARVAVVVPGAAHARRSFDHSGLQAEAAGAVQQVQTGKTGADDQQVQRWRGRGMGLGVGHGGKVDGKATHCADLPGGPFRRQGISPS